MELILRELHQACDVESAMPPKQPTPISAPHIAMGHEPTVRTLSRSPLLSDN